MGFDVANKPLPCLCVNVTESHHQHTHFYSISIDVVPVALKGHNTQHSGHMGQNIQN